MTIDMMTHRGLVRDEFDELLYRKGKFRLTMDALKKDWRVFMQLFGRMIIWRVEYMFLDDIIEYQAVSEMFEVCLEGARAPNYEFTFEEQGVLSMGGCNTRIVEVSIVGGADPPFTLIITTNADKGEAGHGDTEEEKGERSQRRGGERSTESEKEDRENGSTSG